MRDPELKDFTRFMFIDADIQFEPEDVAKLWNLSEHNEVVTACYSTKREDTATTAWKNGNLVDLNEFTGPTPIDYAGTGFLMIQRSCFEKMQEAYPETRHVEGKLGEVYALFDTKVSGEPAWGDRFYVSEDYLFCERWKAIGGEIILDPSIRLGHVGRKVYY
jgi:choline kinase